MTRVRRSTYAFINIQDGQSLDVTALLEGRAVNQHVRQIYALSILREEIYPISKEELDLLCTVSSREWMALSDVTEGDPAGVAVAERLIRLGLLLSDGDDDVEIQELRQKHDDMEAAQWNIFAAFYHFMTKWHDVHLDINLPRDLVQLAERNVVSTEVMDKFVELNGLPPPHFYSRPKHIEAVELPLLSREHGLYEVLVKRKTTRAYDRDTAMTTEELSNVLYYVFGCHGFSVSMPGLVGLKRCSPSGGSLHPIEAYLLVTNVEGLTPGFYHYSMENHALEALEYLERTEAEDLANEFTAGQSFPRAAHVLVIMAARFYRNFWKYRKHQRAYAVILMDAGHLSQNFNLVCTELGLGSFVTAAINSANIERRLGLDGIREGAILICGCLKPLPDIAGLDPNFLKYVPRLTTL